MGDITSNWLTINLSAFGTKLKTRLRHSARTKNKQTDKQFGCETS